MVKLEIQQSFPVLIGLVVLSHFLSLGVAATSEKVGAEI